jgi:hypothetical protein
VGLNWFAAAFAGWQCLVFVVIASFAYICRNNRTASAIVAAMGLFCLAVEIYTLYNLSKPAYGPLVRLTSSLYVQSVLGFYGCYVGYAFVEAARLRDYRDARSIRGKLLVGGILAAAALLVLINYMTLVR